MTDEAGEIFAVGNAERNKESCIKDEIELGPSREATASSEARRRSRPLSRPHGRGSGGSISMAWQCTDLVRCPVAEHNESPPRVPWWPNPNSSSLTSQWARSIRSTVSW